MVLEAITRNRTQISCVPFHRSCGFSQAARTAASKEEMRPVAALCGGRGALHFFFFWSHLLFSPFFSLLLVLSQIRGHIADSSPPSPLSGTCLALLSREDFSPFLPHRLASNCASWLGSLSSWDKPRSLVIHNNTSPFHGNVEAPIIDAQCLLHDADDNAAVCVHRMIYREVYVPLLRDLKTPIYIYVYTRE